MELQRLVSTVHVQHVRRESNSLADVPVSLRSNPET